MNVQCIILLFTVILASCSTANNGSTDVDSDSDNPWDTGECDDNDYCGYSCVHGWTVPDDTVGVLAAAEEICGAAGAPVLSSEAALLRLDATTGVQNTASGLIEIPENLRDRVVGLPELAFDVDSYAIDEWSSFEVSSLVQNNAGFSFEITWPLLPFWADCDIGYPTTQMYYRIQYSIECDALDAGPPDGGGGEVLVLVEAPGVVKWCYETTEAENANWYSPGEECPFSCGWEWQAYPCD